MAEIEVLTDFGFAGGNSSVLGASSRIRFFKDQEYQYTMDMVRDYRMSLGFNQYRAGTQERLDHADIADWGLLSLQLVTTAPATWQDSKGTLFQNMTEKYFNTTGVAAANQTLGRNNTTPARGPIGGVLLDLRTSGYVFFFFLHKRDFFFPLTLILIFTFFVSYEATYINGSRISSAQKSGPFSVATRNLTFPDLRLDQSHTSNAWRFTDHLCLPPRIELGAPDATHSDIWGEMSRDCTKYRYVVPPFSLFSVLGLTFVGCAR